MIIIAGFFGFFDYTKPGKGVPKDAPKKNAFIQFFILLYRKFFNLIKLNLLYILFSIPFLLIMIFVFSPFILSVEITRENHSLYVYFLCLFFAYIGIAPVSIGLSYVLRNYAREEHAWVFQDFWEQIKINFKTSILIFIIDMVFMVIAFINFSIYRFLAVDSIFYLISKVILISGCILYSIIHFYLYQFILTFEISLWSAFKNSLILALAKLPMNLFIMAMIFVAGWIIILFPFLSLFIGITPFAFAINFYVQRVISKNIISSMENENEASDEEDSDKI